MGEADAFDEIVAAIRQDLATATEGLMAASEAGLRDVVLVRNGDGEALSRIEGGLLSVLEACSLEDIIGQRLTQLQSVSARQPVAGAVGEAGGLQNGPARPGQGLDQTRADAWFSMEDDETGRSPME
ncbi:MULTISPECIES: hypothetical protein [unclassified Brevundimonas]|uniref:hypothetical protein n=1 Tax=unclassified Brevundimonas TaxID=2622653 RepID=UPI003F90A659